MIRDAARTYEEKVVSSEEREERKRLTFSRMTERKRSSKKGEKEEKEETLAFGQESGAASRAPAVEPGATMAAGSADPMVEIPATETEPRIQGGQGELGGDVREGDVRRESLSRLGVDGTRIDVKAIFTDLDGTLWTPGSVCHEDNRILLERVAAEGAAAGTAIIPCTGRSLMSTKRGKVVFDVPALSPFPGVYFDGSVVYGDSEDEVLLDAHLSRAELAHVLTALDRVDATGLIGAACQNGIIVRTTKELSDRLGLENISRWDEDFLTFSALLTASKNKSDNEIGMGTETEGGSEKEVGHSSLPMSKIPADAKVYSLFFFTNIENGPERIREELDGKFEITAYGDPVSAKLVQVKPQGTNKLTGIHACMKHYGLRPEEIVCIGDGCNDVKMLGGLANSIAMRNGQRAAIAAAQNVSALTCAKGGWAMALRRFVRLDETAETQDLAPEHPNDPLKLGHEDTAGLITVGGGGAGEAAEGEASRVFEDSANCPTSDW